MCGHNRACGQVHDHGCVSVCVHVCVCVYVHVKESTVEMHSHGHMCLHVCLHRCLHMGVGWPSPRGLIAGMQSLLCYLPGEGSGDCC